MMLKLGLYKGGLVLERFTVYKITMLEGLLEARTQLFHPYIYL